MKKRLVFDPNYVRELDNVENRFLQVLVDRFELRRTPQGVSLCVDLDGKSPAIWNLGGKLCLQKNVQRLANRAKRYQEEIERFIADGTRDSWVFNDAEFPFRFVSGGALPVLRIGSRNYYALIYRECFPIGWNLANGASDSRQEMFNPFITVERELREELIIADFKRNRRYVFDIASDNPEDMPEHVLARSYWSRKLHLQRTLDEFERVPAPIKWIDGPDALEVRLGNKEGGLTGCFLNINALDGGIELDRIAKIRVEEAALLDGELLYDDVVGSPVGLFEVSRMHREIRKGSRSFLPDRFYFRGLPSENPKGLAAKLVGDYLPHMCRLTGSEDRRRYWDKAPEKFDLCPATRGILRRAASYLREEPRDDAAHDIFISFASEDAALASDVCHFLTEKTNRKVFFSPRDSRPSFADSIDRALETASVLVAVSSRPDHLRKLWVEYEYRSFNVLMLNERKPKGAALLSYIADFNPQELPLPLVGNQAVKHDPTRPKQSLQQILGYLPKKRTR